MGGKGHWSEFKAGGARLAVMGRRAKQQSPTRVENMTSACERIYKTTTETESASFNRFRGSTFI